MLNAKNGREKERPDSGSRYVPYLRESTLFRGLDERALLVVAEAARVRHVRGGEFFFHQGDPALVLYVLVRGQVKFTQVTLCYVEMLRMEEPLLSHLTFS